MDYCNFFSVVFFIVVVSRIYLKGLYLKPISLAERAGLYISQGANGISWEINDDF